MSKYKLTYQNNDLKRFIHSFDFADPNWENLPPDFPNCPNTPNLPKFPNVPNPPNLPNTPNIPNSPLTKAEQGLLTGIKLAWYLEKGRPIIYERCLKVGFTISFVIITGLYMRFVSTTPAFTSVKEVSAATVSASIKKMTTQKDDDFADIWEATISAIRNN